MNFVAKVISNLKGHLLKNQTSKISRGSSWHMYDKLAPYYRDISDKRKAWITSINSYIINRLKQNDRLLDVGTGDGVRTRNIADAVGIKNISLVDPSAAMYKLAKNTQNSTVYNISAESLLKIRDQGTYDAILCLWNVLGHVPTFERRVLSVQNMIKLLNTGGLLFIDVNNRYNSRAYGDKVKSNMLLDKNDPKGYTGKNGDVTYEIRIGDEVIPASGHVFTEKELKIIATEAGANIIEVTYFDYDTGEQVNTQFEGQILIILGKK